MFKKNTFVCSIASLFCLLMGIVMLNACAAHQQPVTLNFVEYPTFFTAKDSYKTVVVGPVENTLDPQKYETFVASNLMAKVQQNGAYKVIDATKDAKSDSALAAKGREKDPNALVLTSMITNYGEVRSSDLGSIGIYDSSSSSATAASSSAVAVNGRKGAAASSSYASASESRKSVSLPVLNFSRGMYAKLNLVLKRASDGEIVANEFVYSLVTEKGFFGLNMSDSEERLKRALDEVTTNAVYYVVPSNESMTINPDSILFVQKYGTDDWISSTKFGVNDTIRIVFVMPERVIYNDYQLELKAEGRPDALDYQEINYSGPVVLEYKAADLIQSTGGAMTYMIYARNGSQVLSKIKFKLEQEK